MRASEGRSLNSSLQAPFDLCSPYSQIGQTDHCWHEIPVHGRRFMIFSGKGAQRNTHSQVTGKSQEQRCQSLRALPKAGMRKCWWTARWGWAEIRRLSMGNSTSAAKKEFKDDGKWSAMVSGSWAKPNSLNYLYKEVFLRFLVIFA